jgi:hypothetical protein
LNQFAQACTSLQKLEQEKGLNKLEPAGTSLHKLEQARTSLHKLAQA